MESDIGRSRFECAAYKPGYFGQDHFSVLNPFFLKCEMDNSVIITSLYCRRVGVLIK